MYVVDGPVKLNTGAPVLLNLTSVKGDVAEALATLRTPQFEFNRFAKLSTSSVIWKV